MAVAALLFPYPVKHGRVLIPQNTPVGFEDPDAPVYFQNAFGATETTDDPTIVYPVGEIDIDPETVFARTDRKVLDGPLEGGA